MMPTSPMERLASLPGHERAAFWSRFSDETIASLEYSWRFRARPEQIPPDGDWSIFLFCAGRSSGKTEALAQYLREEDERAPGPYALIGPTAADVRDIMIQRLLSIYPPSERPKWEPTKRRVTLPNGSVCLCIPASEPDRLRGIQLSRAWLDEFAAFDDPQETLDVLMPAMRVSERPRVVISTTPRPLPILRDLVRRPDVVTARGSTFRNRANLPTAYVDGIVERYRGTRLFSQEIEGEILDIEGSLFQSDWFIRIPHPAPKMARVAIGLDPAVSRSHDECGLTAVGVGIDGLYYVLEDQSGRYSPAEWAARAIAMYKAHRAEVIVVERNRGGDMVAHTLRSVDPSVAVHEVHAYQGKAVRAEPVALLAEQRKVVLVGDMSKLVEQATTFDPTAISGKAARSPDRLDSFVHAMTYLTTGIVLDGRIYSAGRRRF